LKPTGRYREKQVVCLGEQRDPDYGEEYVVLVGHHHKIGEKEVP
jgi:hypothetical protein